MKQNNKNPNKKTTIATRLKVILTVFFILLVLLTARLFYLQIIKGPTLKKKMYYSQLITNRVVSPKRGTIYDSTGKPLAISAPVDTVSINPMNIVVRDNGKINKEETKLLKEKVASTFSEIFELDYNETLEKVSSNKQYVTIARKVEKNKIDALKKWMENEKIFSGINIDEDNKRYYPNDNLASTLLGFCGYDNEGRFGLELKWDDVLTGIPGKVVTSQDAIQQLIPDENKTYIPAENGSDLILTLDANIQSIVEKYLKQACLENNCTRGGNAIVMDPKTGNILAMATYPDYNLNTPYEIPSNISKKEWDKMSSKEQSNSLYTLYRNRAISDNYEPGSVFKILTAAIALEEDLAEPDTSNIYNCPGYEMVAGSKISCSYKAGHGHQSLREALANSCNPAFIQIGQKIGANTFYNYFNAFGLFDPTGINTSGESNHSIFWNQKDVGPLEIATMSFGQRFKITPLQMLTATASIANNGFLMKPRIVKEIRNTDTGAITSIPPITIRQVISKETASSMMDMLESVVTNGTGKYAKVNGYSIAGKTGTSEPDISNPDEGYTASFLAISPVENPQVVLLVTLYDPQGQKGHHGSTVAAPVASQMLSEILPYMQVPYDNFSSDNNKNLITLPDVQNKTVAEAKKILEKSGFKCISNSNSDEIVVEQVPVKGSKLMDKSIVKLYTENNNTKISKPVPNLIGKNLSEIKKLLRESNLNADIQGSGLVVSQEPIPGSPVEEGTIIKVTLST